ncbi:ABC-F family ATP-binding cassette domain-containing protein [Reyranella sp. CPCC 100927]|uniref:ABC-F family ATP-binding cassette domain-containing protein n=1 Tax=Reyranella sp. CPCC 100927 TaxID=2599616 RepID=UPI0011B468B9|nr:ABC-F family ATP-binding cassette domain-containing protein [Reyranella sp. CPCC 100927]TWT13016.1 ABC-F family ATP-binding cassette domain-containing protein [Reyranella sp. CPCC 100927]
MFHINDLVYRIAGRVLFDRATVAVADGHRVGLVGRNGTGKSTLLRLIRGETAIDGGSITMRANARVGEVSQEAPGGARSVLDTVLEADRERTALLAEAETATDPHRVAEIHTRLADIGAHAAPARAGSILNGLGFDHAAQGRACDTFSGGWRMRVALAQALFAEPDLLLLDEPSNHLDIEARLWLADYLRTYRYTLLLVSHDRELLNAVCNQIIHIDQGKLVAYAGNYDRFERTRRERAERQAALQTRQIAERKRIQSFVDRFRAKASKARQAQSRIKLLEKMEPIVPIAEEVPVEFAFPSPDKLPPPLITMDRASVGYAADTPVLQKLDLRIDMDDRIALLGQNGNGKSTFIRLVADRLKPLSGTVRKSGKMRVGYFSQQQEEELDLDGTPFEHMRRLMPDAPPTKVRAQLGRFMFSGPKADQTVRSLSGGEKTRLLFALMTRDAPHVLLLDEPTNHLDMDSRTALVEALNEYEGAVILVSHDAHLVRLVADRLWLIAGGTCTSFEGDLDDYEQQLLSERGSGRGGNGADQASGATAEQRKEQRRQAAGLRQKLAPLRKAIDRAEKELATLTDKRTALQERLNDPALYNGNQDAVAALQIELGDIGRRIAAAEETWLESQQALEQAQSVDAA